MPNTEQPAMSGHNPAIRARNSLAVTAPREVL
jgi:hypothetical protein